MDSQPKPEASPLQPVDESLQDVSQAVAQELEEHGKKIRKKINRAIQLVGMGRIVELVTLAKGAHGTMLVADGSRPRTLGGCFFELLRQELGDQMLLIQPQLIPCPPEKRRK
jgi:hypothetical protein